MDLAKRKDGLGGSEIAGVLGYEAFSTAVEIWQDKISSQVEETILRPDNNTAGMYWGKVLEEHIIDVYRLVKDTRVTSKKANGDDLDQFYHPQYPWLIANVDGIAHTKEHGDIILEVKAWNFDVENVWGEDGTDNIPIQYVFQVQHYMNVLNMPMAHVVLKLGAQTRFFKIPRSNEMINGMHADLKHFWFENVQKKIPPDPSNLKDVSLIYNKSNDKEKEATIDQIEEVKNIRKLRNEISTLTKTLDLKKTKVANNMGACSRLVSGNEKLATFNSDKTGTRRSFRVSK